MQILTLGSFPGFPGSPGLPYGQNEKVDGYSKTHTKNNNNNKCKSANVKNRNAGMCSHDHNDTKG